MAKKYEGRVKDIMKKYQQSFNAKAVIMEQAIELDRFDRGEQWNDNGLIPPWVPKPVTNYVHLAKTTQRANLALPNQTALLRPARPADVQGVSQVQRALDAEWYRMEARFTVRNCIESALLLGTSIAQVYYDDDFIGGTDGERYKGLIGMREIDFGNFFPDPNAYRLHECAFVHITELMPLNWVQNNPKFLEHAGKEAIKNLKNDQEQLNDSEIYKRPSLPDQANGDLVMLHTHYERTRVAGGRFKLSVTYIVNGTEVYRIDDVKPSRYPFAILYDYPQRKSFWGMGTGRLILENQKIVNKVEQVASIIGTLMQNPQKEVVKDSGIDPKEVAAKGNLAGKVWVSNIPNGIRNIDPPPIPKDLFTLAETAKGNIREIAGMNEAYMGESVGSLTTSTGVNSLIERATIRDKDKMIEIEIFIKDIVELIVQFMLIHYKDKRWIRILGEDGTPSFEQFRGKDHEELQYDIQVDVSGKMPTTRALLAQQARDLLNMQGQYGFNPPIITPEETIDMLDIRDSEKIKKRMQEDKLNHTADVAVQISQQLYQATLEGAPQEQLQQMAQQMVQELLNPSRIGSTEQGGQSNTGAMDSLTTDAMMSGR